MTDERRWCGYCGREMEVVELSDNMYDRDTGAPLFRTWYRCPRFPRSWRNFWMGGCHDCVGKDHSGRRMWL